MLEQTAGSLMQLHLLLQVDDLSKDAQQVIHKYTQQQSQAQTGNYASLCAATGILPWQPPTAQDHATLLAVHSFPLASALCLCYAVNTCLQCLLLA